MRSRRTAKPAHTTRTRELHAVCEKAARSVLSVAHGARRGIASRAALSELVDTLADVIERTTELLLAGKQVRVIEGDEGITTREAADLLNVSSPKLLTLLDTGQIPQLPRVGRHRRVARAAVLKYKRTRDVERELAPRKLPQCRKSTISAIEPYRTTQTVRESVLRLTELTLLGRRAVRAS